MDIWTYILGIMLLTIVLVSLGVVIAYELHGEKNCSREQLHNSIWLTVIIGWILIITIVSVTLNEFDRLL